MNLSINRHLLKNYHSNSQIIRISTESWLSREVFCPNCGNSLQSYENNKPVADHYCLKCLEDFELKSTKKPFTSKVVDGAYQTMIKRLKDDNNPNFFLLNYDLNTFKVTNFVVIPKYFFLPNMIEKRKPLSPTAKRAGWVGCNILINNIPESGKVYYVKSSQIYTKKQVLHKWKHTLFLKEKMKTLSKSWIIDIMKCIEKINKLEFKLEDIYAFENALSLRHPNNKHIKDKIRQQLQLLRDTGYLDFTSPGHYRVCNQL